jgi:hypothetical protein
MVSKLFKKDIIPAILFSVALSLSFAFGFLLPFAKNSEAVRSSTSIYEDSAFNFYVPDPSSTQGKEMTGTNGITKCSPFHLLEKTPVYVNEQIKSQEMVIFFDELSDLDCSMYTKERLIKQSQSEILNPLLLPFSFAKTNGYSLGDKISLITGKNGYIDECQVASIYEDNTFFGSMNVLCALWTEEVSSSFSTAVPYSGLFIQSNDCPTTKDYLKKSYVPMADAPKKEDYSTDEKYQAALNEFLSKDYSNLVYDMTEQKETAESGVTKQKHDISLFSVIAPLTIGAAELACTFIFLLIRKSDYERLLLSGASKGSFVCKDLLILVCECALFAAINIPLSYFFANSLASYLNAATLVRFSLISIGVMFAGGLLGFTSIDMGLKAR